jgi:hypothetical protein
LLFLPFLLSSSPLLLSLESLTESDRLATEAEPALDADEVKESACAAKEAESNKGRSSARMVSWGGRRGAARIAQARTMAAPPQLAPISTPAPRPAPAAPTMNYHLYGAPATAQPVRALDAAGTAAGTSN